MADIITRLKLDSSGYNSRLNNASRTLLEYTSKVKNGSEQLHKLTKENVDFVRALGQQETRATSITGKIGELKNAYTNMSVAYQQLTDKEKQSPFGQALRGSLDQLKTRLNDAQNQLKNVQTELGGTNGSLDGLATSLGGSMNPLNMLDGALGKFGVSLSDVGSTITSVTGLSAGMATGIAAVGAAVAAATAELIKYNQELAKQDQRVNVVTGLDGSAATDMRNEIDAITKAYNVDFNEAVSAINTMMNKLGVSSGEALQIMKDGLQGMTEGDAPKFLQLMDQFGPAFRDMGLSASETAAIIHESLGGAFGEDGMASIQQAGRRIREMGTDAQGALEGIGIDAKKMQSDIASGNMTIMQAIQQVTGKIKEVGINSTEAGQAMKSVFGRNGANLGSAQIEAIANLNTNLQETKTRTGELGDVNVKLQNAYADLNTHVSAFFGDTESGLSTIADETKADLMVALADVVKGLEAFKPEWDAIKQAGVDCFNIMKDYVGDTITAIGDILSILGDILNMFGTVETSANSAGSNIKMAMQIATAPMKILRELLDWIAILFRNVREAANQFMSKMKEKFESPSLQWVHDKIKGIAEWIQKVINKYRELKQELGAGDGGKGASSVGAGGVNGIKLGNTNGGTGGGSGSGSGGSGGSGGKGGKGKTTTTKPTEQWQPIDMASYMFPDSSIASIQKQLKRAQDMYNEAGDAAGRAYAQSLIDKFTEELDQIKNENLSGIVSGLVIDQKSIESYFKGQQGLDGLATKGDKMKKAFTGAASALSSMGQALSAFGEDSKAAAAAANTMSIAAAIANLVGQFAAIPKGPEIWSWIAGTAAGVATLVTTIAQIKQATAGSYAEGGVIGGNSYVGDKLYARVNSGETILNQQQAQTALDMMDGKSVSGQSAQPYVSGEMLYLGLNNWAKRTGRGEIVFAR